MATSSLQKFSRQGSVDLAPMLRRPAQRMMPTRLRVVRKSRTHSRVCEPTPPVLHEKPFGLHGSSTVNRMHECEMARTSQFLNSSRFDALTNDVILAIRRTSSGGAAGSLN